MGVAVGSVLEAVLKLASSCDVYVENFRGGKATQLGLEVGVFAAATVPLSNGGISKAPALCRLP